jgi:hypothetical protein
VLLLVWVNAGWHIRHVVRDWITAHTRHGKQIGMGVRILTCLLTSSSTWLHPIEPN